MKLGRVLEGKPSGGENITVVVQPLNALLEPIGKQFPAENPIGAQPGDLTLIVEAAHSQDANGAPLPRIAEIVRDAKLLARENPHNEDFI